MLALQALTPARMTQLIPPATLEESRKIVAAIHRDEGVPAVLQGARRLALEAVRRMGHVPTLDVVHEVRSEVDPFRKLLMRAPDGRELETVRIPLEKAGRFSVCVSSQVGCALACAFCATGRMGLVRNLETWEIVEQVRAVRRTLSPGERVHGVVFQGMGEPLSNLDRVIEAIGVLTDPCALAIDTRAITVCTAGLPSGIRRLAKELPRVRLGLSIGSARPDTRRRLMPIDRAHSLEDVLEAVKEHARIVGQSPMFAVTPLAGVNDTDDDARALARLAKDFARDTGIRPRISVIPYNRIDEDDAADPFRRTEDARATRFRDVMKEEGVFSHLRYSGGGDVAAACGQLVTGRPS